MTFCSFDCGLWILVQYNQMEKEIFVGRKCYTQWRLLCTKPTIMKMPPAIKHFSQRRRRSLEPIRDHNPFLLMKSLIVCTISPDTCETETKWNVEKKRAEQKTKWGKLRHERIQTIYYPTSAEMSGWYYHADCWLTF